MAFILRYLGCSSLRYLNVQKGHLFAELLILKWDPTALTTTERKRNENPRCFAVVSIPGTAQPVAVGSPSPKPKPKSTKSLTIAPEAPEGLWSLNKVHEIDCLVGHASDLVPEHGQRKSPIHLPPLQAVPYTEPRAHTCRSTQTRRKRLRAQI